MRQRFSSILTLSSIVLAVGAMAFPCLAQYGGNGTEENQDGQEGWPGAHAQNPYWPSGGPGGNAWQGATSTGNGGPGEQGGTGGRTPDGIGGDGKNGGRGDDGDVGQSYGNCPPGGGV